MIKSNPQLPTKLSLSGWSTTTLIVFDFAFENCFRILKSNTILQKDKQNSIILVCSDMCTTGPWNGGSLFLLNGSGSGVFMHFLCKDQRITSVNTAVNTMSIIVLQPF